MTALGPQVATQIVRALEERIAASDDPRSRGAMLAGEHEGYRQWRIGDHRVVGRIEEERVTVLIVRMAHRREVYR
ncbi:hypothetical protein ASE95_06720 [Sphingomonas sp. Leaf231]|nr:hypothetical protein ASE95_06720 [Sphingomonas sp. Leaf231]